MSDDFDALHLWLGIPPEQQPANHYRLLGLADFESNLDAIEAAVDQRMGFVRQKAGGKQSAKSQEVLNLLSSARVCLLDLAAKEKYDRQLRAAAAAKQAASRVIPVAQPLLPAAVALPAPPPVTPVDPLASSPMPSAAPFVLRSTAPAQQPLLRPGVVAAAIAGLVVVLLIGVVGMMALGNRGDTSLVEANVSPGSPPVTGTAPPPPPPASNLPSPAPPPPSTSTVPSPAPAALPPENPSAAPLSPVAGPAEVPPGAPTQPVVEELRLPLLPRAAGQKWLIVCSDDERGRVERACKDHGVPFEVSDFDIRRQDYSNIHSIVVGSNHMDYWGQGDERKRPESFDPIEKFVEAGGHLIVMGAFNGRNMQHMQRFGITTGVRHCSFYKEVPGRTEVLFAGASDVPTNRHLQSAGNFHVSVPHVMLVARADNGEPAVATLAHGKGRVTFTLCEPEWQGDLWFLSAIALWNLRGAPTSLLDEPLPLELASSDAPKLAEEATPGGAMPDRSLANLLEQDQPLPQRLPIPSPEELAAAEKIIVELFKQQLESKKPAEMRALAEQLLRHAADSDDDRASQYALYQQALEQATGARDIGLAMQSIEELATRFEVDRNTLKVELLPKLAKGTTDPATIETIVVTALDLTADLIDAEAFELAARASTLALSGASRAPSKSWREVALAADQRVKGLVREAEQAAKHQATLQTDPQNAEANLGVGSYYCLVLGKWSKGLPHLALGSDQQLQAASQLELDATQPELKKAKQLGDLWMAAATSLPPSQRLGAQARARHWYQQGLTQAVGLTRAELESKLQKLPSPAFQIQLHVEDVHGIEELHLTADSIRWDHKTWGWPQLARFNGFVWRLEANPILRNRGSTQLLPPGLDFSSVTVRKLHGRGEVIATPAPQGAMIRIDDQPDGFDDYDILITFGSTKR